MIPPRVVADERERQSGVPDLLARLNVRVYYSRLPVADYVVSQEIAVERKSLPDFVASVYDGRLFAQASAVSSSFKKAYLLVEGDTKDLTRIARNVSSYYGAVASITLAYDLRVVFTPGPEGTAMMLAALVQNRGVGPIPPGTMVVPQKGKEMSEQQLYLVASLPGVGIKLAKRLLARHGTARRVMALTRAQLAIVQGVGWKRAEKITAVLDKRYMPKNSEAARQESLGSWNEESR